MQPHGPDSWPGPPTPVSFTRGNGIVASLLAELPDTGVSET